ncbi:MAG: CBS domain-containing protein [Haloarculaceae archaeon]
MEDIFVGRVMSTNTHTVAPDTLVADAADEMRDNDVGSVMVVDGENELCGILTATDFVHIVAESQPKAETTVERYMTTDVVTTTVQTPIRHAADAMMEHGFHHLPVVDDREGVVGMLSTADLTAYLSHARLPSPS